MLYKKGDKHKIENYRPLSLTSNMAKVYAKIIKNRLKSQYELTQPEEQAGFRSKYSTINNLHIINQLIEKSNEYNMGLHMAFVDFQKAFDNVKHKFLWKAMKSQGYEIKNIKIIKEMYCNTEAYVYTDVEGSKFKIRKGIKQGDPLSAILFNIALEEVFKNIEWEEKGKGIEINGKYLSHLRFADDVVILAETREELEKMINELNDKSKIAGLEINLKKTHIIANKDYEHEIKIGKEKIEKKDDVIYLGQNISLKNRYGKEVKRRIKIGWAKFWSLKRIFKSTLKPEMKSKVFNACIVPAVAYGSQTWAMKEEDKNKIQTMQNKMEKSMLEIKQITRIKTEKVKKKIPGNKNIVEECLGRKWDWAGHLARHAGEKWDGRITDWYLGNKKRNPGRQYLRWADDFKNLLSHKMYHRVAMDRKEWYRLRSAFTRKGNKYCGGSMRLS